MSPDDKSFAIMLGGTIFVTSLITGGAGLPLWACALVVGGSAALLIGIYIANK
jgi:hypothetical protein